VSPTDATIPAATVPAVATVAPRRRPRAWYVVAVVMLIVAIGALIALRMRETKKDVVVVATPIPKPVAPVASTTTVDVPPPVTETGRLLINAFPWGQVTSVRNASGEERLTGGSAETPLLLSLPAGEYQVHVTNPNSTRTVVLDATVSANALSRVETEIDRIDANGYLDGVGIGK